MYSRALLPPQYCCADPSERIVILRKLQDPIPHNPSRAPRIHNGESKTRICQSTDACLIPIPAAPGILSFGWHIDLGNLQARILLHGHLEESILLLDFAITFKGMPFLFSILDNNPTVLVPRDGV